jgi:predicted transcriptional regulator
MSKAAASSKGASESIRISSEVKQRLQEYCRQRNQPLRRMLDRAIYAYVQERLNEE